MGLVLKFLSDSHTDQVVSSEIKTYYCSPDIQFLPEYLLEYFVST